MRLTFASLQCRLFGHRWVATDYRCLQLVCLVCSAERPGYRPKE